MKPCSIFKSLTDVEKTSTGAVQPLNQQYQLFSPPLCVSLLSAFQARRRAFKICDVGVRLNLPGKRSRTYDPFARKIGQPRFCGSTERNTPISGNLHACLKGGQISVVRIPGCWLQFLIDDDIVGCHIPLGIFLVNKTNLVFLNFTTRRKLNSLLWVLTLYFTLLQRLTQISIRRLQSAFFDGP